MSTTLVIYGAGGHGKSVVDLAVACGYENLCILDDNPRKIRLLKWSVESSAGFLDNAGKAFEFVVAIGDNAARRCRYDQLSAAGGTAVTLLHPRAWVSPFASLGGGTVVFGGAIVNADGRIGANCIINTQAGVDHDCIVADHVHVGPGAGLAGGVQVGNGSFIGMGARLLPGVQLGERTVIGAGAIVRHNIPADARAYGIPARVVEPSKKS